MHWFQFSFESFYGLIFQHVLRNSLLPERNSKVDLAMQSSTPFLSSYSQWLWLKWRWLPWSGEIRLQDTTGSAPALAYLSPSVHCMREDNQYQSKTNTSQKYQNYLEMCISFFLSLASVFHTFFFFLMRQYLKLTGFIKVPLFFQSGAKIGNTQYYQSPVNK